MTQLFSGKEVSASVYESLTPKIQALKSKGITPGLAVILVGDDPASAVYVRSKTRKFASLDLFSETIRFDSDISQEDLILKIQDLNVDNRFHGILVQFPLPKHIDEGSIISLIDAVKDVDGFHPENVGYLTGGNPRFIPCTPKGIMRILSFYGVELSGKHVVIIGRSNIVGRPVSILTSLKKSFSNATTTICHSGTQDIRHFTNQADVVVTAMGVPNFLEELIEKIQDLNVDNQFHGILVQLPLPKHIDEDTIISLINPVKDVDGFHPENVGYLTVGNPRFIPCTPKGIMRILSYYDVDLSGKHVVIIGRSNIVGRPVSILTSLKKSFSNATTTICHSGTQDIRYFTNQADVVVTAMGVPNFLDESFIKPGTVLIDVGINRVNDNSEKGYKLVGDIHAESVSGIAGALTPVPGGVGPMTIAMLVENTVEAAEMQSGVGA